MRRIHLLPAIPLLIVSLLAFGCGSSDTTDETCSDGTLNQTETDVDCGGVCSGCGEGQACLVDDDCISDSCGDDGTCQPGGGGTCDDGEKNQDETDVDCGGTTCDTCPDGSACLADDDCINGDCNMGTCQTLPQTCSDGQISGDETDVDCGGSCDPCGDGSACFSDDDCLSGSCTNDICESTAVTCNDGQQNGLETDVDCGGVCPPCPDGSDCILPSDCQSGFCDGGVCVISGEDLCPDDPDKTAPGVCGCGVPDADSDLDGLADCIDGCPDDPDKFGPGACGCGVPDTDSDGDGLPDCNDPCVDVDDDGYGVGAACAGADCDDNDPARFPGNTEACDGKDNDCDGNVPILEADNDDDGFRICDGDCNDNDPDCHEGQCCPAQCLDNDGDGYGIGPDCTGPDCNDSDLLCWEGACCQGNMTCSAMLDCIQNCPDQICVDDCYAQGTPGAQQLFDVLLQCITDSGCSQDDLQCIAQNCGTEAWACMQDS